jgi:hypothetical protein
MRLPNAHLIDRASIADKVQRYCLNENHEKGQYKALLFRRLLGITQENSGILIEAVYAAAQTDEVHFIKTTAYCDLYSITFALTTGTTTAMIRTGWCVRRDTAIPHLTTAFIE